MLKCPKCESKTQVGVLRSNTKAYISLQENFATYKGIDPECVSVRKRKCLACGYKFFTYEYFVAEAQNMGTVLDKEERETRSCENCAYYICNTHDGIRCMGNGKPCKDWERC